MGSTAPEAFPTLTIVPLRRVSLKLSRNLRACVPGQARAGGEYEYQYVCYAHMTRDNMSVWVV